MNGIDELYVEAQAYAASDQADLAELVRAAADILSFVNAEDERRYVDVPGRHNDT